MRLSHVSLNARDADALSRFYKDAFGFAERRPPRRLHGATVSRGNGLPNSDVCAIWLNQPDRQGPFLEIMEYSEAVERRLPAVNEPGFAHLAFEVGDLQTTIRKVIQAGGSMQGEVINFGTQQQPFLIVYVRDPEGNILELEQRFNAEEVDMR